MSRKLSYGHHRFFRMSRKLFWISQNFSDVAKFFGIGRLPLTPSDKEQKPRDRTRARAQTPVPPNSETTHPPKMHAPPPLLLLLHRQCRRRERRTHARTWENPPAIYRTSDSARWMGSPPLSEEPLFPDFPNDTQMTDSASGQTLSSGNMLLNLSGTAPPGSAEFQSQYQQLFGDRADSRALNTIPTDHQGRSAIAPAPRGRNEYSPRGQRDRHPALGQPRTRDPAQDRPRNSDRAPARPSRTLVLTHAFFGLEPRYFSMGIVLVGSAPPAEGAASVLAARPPINTAAGLAPALPTAPAPARATLPPTD